MESGFMFQAQNLDEKVWLMDEKVWLIFTCSVYIYPPLFNVTTTGQHKRSTTKMLQIDFISNMGMQQRL